MEGQKNFKGGGGLLGLGCLGWAASFDIVMKKYLSPKAISL